MLSDISVWEDEEQDQHDLDIDIVPQYYLDPYLAPIPNRKPKWDEKLIEAARNVLGIQMIEEEWGPNITMNMLHSLTQLHYLQSGATKFQRDATDDEDWSAIWPTDEQNGSFPSSSRKKRQKQHSADRKKMQRFTI